MRKITKAEGETWLALAREHGFGSDEGRFTLGRFIVESRDEGGLILRVITPIPAVIRAPESVAPVATPIMFDRTPANEIIIPGLWWRLMFEKVSEDVDAPDEMRQMANTMVTTTVCNDVLLPADSDTIEISTPNSRGDLVRCEALPPGTRMRARLQVAATPGTPSRA